MSATAELQYPNSYTTHGKTYHKNKPVPVDFETAAFLQHDARFKIGGLDTLEAVQHKALLARPAGDNLLAAIRDAADALDIDDESNFTASGKPSHLAIGAALGYPVSAEERDRAVSTKSTGKLETADASATPAKKTPKIIAPVAQAAAKAVDPTTEGALQT